MTEQEVRIVFFQNSDHCLRLYETLRRICTLQQAAWLEQALIDIAGENGVEMHGVYSAMARRKMGESAIYLSASEAESIGNAWLCSDATRTLMLKQLIDCHSPAEHRSLINSVYQAGDEYERAAILKGLCLLDPEGRMVELSIHCGRTNSHRLFAAIALLNPYAARHYSNSAFNQLVLKALFMQLDIRQIIQLHERRNRALNAMCLDYIRELQAAGRDIPDTITYALAYDLLSDQEKDFLSKLNRDQIVNPSNNEPAY